MLINQLEIGFLDRSPFRLTVDPDDTAIWRLENPPLRGAGHRIGIEFSQVSNRSWMARISKQVVEALWILLLGTELVKVVPSDSYSELIPNKQQVAFPLPLLREVPENASRGDTCRQHRRQNEHTEIRQAGFGSQPS